MDNKKQTTDIKNIVSRVVSQIQEGSQYYNVIENAWSDCVGEGAASHARPTYVKEGVVWVEVDNSLHLFELKAEREKTLRQLQERCPEIINIKYRIR